MNEKKKDEIKTEKVPDAKKKDPVFTKAQLISSKKYKNRKDALSVLLADDKFYTFEETDKIINNFLIMKAI